MSGDEAGAIDQIESPRRIRQRNRVVADRVRRAPMDTGDTCSARAIPWCYPWRSTMHHRTDHWNDSGQTHRHADRLPASGARARSVAAESPPEPEPRIIPPVAHRRFPETTAHHNPDPVSRFDSLEALREDLCRINPRGDAFLDWLLDGPWKEGKGIWINPHSEVRRIYESILARQPELITESPWHPRFRTDQVTTRGDNPVSLSHIGQATSAQRAVVTEHQSRVASGAARPVALFSGGPAAKIAAVLSQLAHGPELDTRFIIDRAVQSNESGSASYEHINHANALNAEFDNTGLAIMRTALTRAIFGEPDAAVALDPDYRRVDLLPRAIAARDIPVYVQYELHGIIQKLRKWLGIRNDHDKSRHASRQSTRVLSFIEQACGIPLRVPSRNSRAFFLCMNERQRLNAVRENAHLRKSPGLVIHELSADELARFYGDSVLERVASGDLFSDNACIRHGFDGVARELLEKLGGGYTEGFRVGRIYLDDEPDGGVRVVAVVLEDFDTGAQHLQPVEHLGLSLGQSATYVWDHGTSAGFGQRILDRFRFGLPVPHQTIATGATIQVLFRITDKDRFSELPFTGLKQTHFVEMGGDGDHLLVKLTSGGNIGLPVYSRSYAISALAGLLRVVQPDSGLTYLGTVCAWPCVRGINGPNNGQVVRLADNAAIRFGEGGTGMSKMGSNAQTLLDMIELDHGLPGDAVLAPGAYRQTVIDRRRRVRRWLRKYGTGREV